MAGGAQIFGWLWRGYLRRHSATIGIALALMTVEGASLGLLSYSFKPMFDRIFVAGERGAIPVVAGAVLAIFLARALSGFGQRVLMARAGLAITGDLQKDMVDHLLDLDGSYFQRNPPGGLIERVRGDTTAAANVWNTVLTAAGRDLVSLISLLAVALSIDWVWTAITMAGVPLLVVPLMMLQRWIRRTARSAREEAARIAGRLDEMFHGIVTIKLNRMERREKGRFGATVSRFIDVQLRAQAGQAGMPALVDLVGGVGFAAVLVFGGLQIIDGGKTVGDFMAFFTAIALVFEPLRRLGNVSGAWQAALASLERIHAVFSERATILPPARPKSLPAPAASCDVILENVHLSYGEAPVLRGLSLTAKAGETTALVGPSGAGKSTVFNLLTRLVEPQSGRVTVGGVEVADLALTELRDLFSVVTQDAPMFDDSLRDNICLGRDIPEAALREVIEAAHIDEFLPGLPAGLDSPAGPRGSNLSGGQRQRVAIARALLRDAPILLMDEATSALDAHSERAVQEALSHLAKGRTTLVIAHRLATVRDAARIVVMEAGQVREEGRHEDLLAQGGLYAGLYRLQFAAGS
ncbi:ABC transporter ATP-binding protein [Rhodovulum sulfidophilum]|uniref:ABC transporter ATP-binding protein n=1 Tax=Rhodovulum visakhapatnamense TaxID=364297 RepID=A0ABS1RFV5_9RHOB|nr:ABC transporter ATP-binding protein [Rhodovulum visakhapatnamense]MBL3571776.1 ABC transporter ATP-binding protein [Rhodovulum visakhapatnamense]MBL3578529.1 ABC transporter ATP-binding protein [Rhodovulum visakhapatnamense]OLS44183.1 ABC transporter ATP-binding protein [Rhodovulum sulfidophilum]